MTRRDDCFDTPDSCMSDLCRNSGICEATRSPRPAGLSGDAGPTPEPSEWDALRSMFKYLAVGGGDEGKVAREVLALLDAHGAAVERVGQLEALVQRINAREIFRERGTDVWCVLHSPDSYEPLAVAEPETWALLVARAAVETLEKGTPE